MISYEDGFAALEWLSMAFGFEEISRIIGQDDRLAHAEMKTDQGGIIMLATPTPKYQSPKRHRQVCEPAFAWSSVPYIIDGVLVYVDNLEEHFERARNAGAQILSMPQDSPHGRLYRTEDLEGHRWMFIQRNTPV